MKTYFLAAAAMLAVPTAADAAVTIRFADPTAGSGVITIDTAHLGRATVNGGTTQYSGDGSVPFLTASFTDTSGNERLLQRGDLDGYIQFDSATSTVSVSYTFDDGSVQFPTSTLYLEGSQVAIGTFDGIRLPDFATAGDLFFSVTSADGSQVDSTPGGVTATTTATVSPVPEPATWALMIAGFAATGAALRRRRTTVATA